MRQMRSPPLKICLALLVVLLAAPVTAVPAAAADSGGYVDGRVTNAENEPLSGASVTLIDTNTRDVVASTTADQVGAYTFDAVASGEYEVSAVYDGESGSASVTVRDGTTTTADVVIQGAAPASAGSVTGIVTDGENTPLSGATVKLVDSDGVVASASTDLEGGYAFEAVPSGEYQVVAEYDGTAGFTTATVEAGMTATANVVITGLESSGSPEASISVAEPAAIAPGDTATVEFTVSNSGTATAQSGGLQIGLSGPISIEGVSGDGQNSPTRFFISPIQPGDTRTVTYTLRASAQAEGTATVTVAAYVGSESQTSTFVSLPVESQPETLAQYLRQDGGALGFTDVLEAIGAFNSEDSRIEGYGEVGFTDVLAVIDSYNQ